MMKGLTKFYSIIVALIMAIAIQPVNAQQIDRQQMRQDIDIAESILEEMFETEFETEWWNHNGNKVDVYSGRIFMESERGVEGIYLPGYGVLFTLPGVSRGFINYLDDGHKSTNYKTFANGEKVTKESIVNEIIKFIANYGSTINQLSPDEKIAVIYQSDINNNWVTIMPAHDVDTKDIPNVSVIATVEDIQRYNSNDIDSEAFRNRLLISSSTKKDDSQEDLKIFANILETAFEDGDEKQFELDDINYQFIDNFGVLYSLDISQGDNTFFGILSDEQWDSLANVFATVKWDSLATVMGKSLARAGSLFASIHLDSLGRIMGKSITRADSIFTNLAQDHNVNNPRTQKFIQFQKQDKQNAQKAIKQFLTDLKKYIISYGPTLSSLSSNQYLLVSIDINSGVEEMPKRIVLQVKKSMLDEAGRGDISEQEALNAITVRKF